MRITLYNSLSRQNELFTPLNPEHVSMYLCGPTVYNYVHIGNARGPVVFDVLVKLLRRHFAKVTYVRNITDVDDKINTAAHQQKISIDSISRKYTAIYHDDMARLGVAPPDIEPFATGHISEIIAMIEALIAKGHAYATHGHVLFDVTSAKQYGQLSHRSLDDMLSGTRIEVEDFKRHAADFVLWKPSDDTQPGWQSPWGYGRPGWHIECSVMTATHLGQTIDIHAGGVDLAFPHHENEIVQSECAHDGAPFARWWLHNGMLTFNGAKMSKSVGNIVELHTLLDTYPAEALRLLLLRAHYRQPLDWSGAALAQVIRTLDGWYGVLRDLHAIHVEPDTPIPESVESALMDDLNTPQALAELSKLADAARQHHDTSSKSRLLAAGAALGLLQQSPEAWFHQGHESVDAQHIEALLEKRRRARANKDFVQADQIRDELDKLGVVIEDGASGTRWSIKH